MRNFRLKPRWIKILTGAVICLAVGVYATSSSWAAMCMVGYNNSKCKTNITDNNTVKPASAQKPTNDCGRMGFSLKGSQPNSAAWPRRALKTDGTNDTDKWICDVCTGNSGVVEDSKGYRRYRCYHKCENEAEATNYVKSKAAGKVVSGTTQGYTGTYRDQFVRHQQQCTDIKGHITVSLNSGGTRKVPLLTYQPITKNVCGKCVEEGCDGVSQGNGTYEGCYKPCSQLNGGQALWYKLTTKGEMCCQIQKDKMESMNGNNSIYKDGLNVPEEAGQDVWHRNVWEGCYYTTEATAFDGNKCYKQRLKTCPDGREMNRNNCTCEIGCPNDYTRESQVPMKAINLNAATNSSGQIAEYCMDTPVNGETEDTCTKEKCYKYSSCAQLAIDIGHPGAFDDDGNGGCKCHEGNNWITSSVTPECYDSSSQIVASTSYRSHNNTSGNNDKSITCYHYDSQGVECSGNDILVKDQNGICSCKTCEAEYGTNEQYNEEYHKSGYYNCGSGKKLITRIKDKVTGEEKTYPLGEYMCGICQELQCSDYGPGYYDNESDNTCAMKIDTATGCYRCCDSLTKADVAACEQKKARWSRWVEGTQCPSGNPIPGDSCRISCDVTVTQCVAKECPEYLPSDCASIGSGYTFKSYISGGCSAGVGACVKDSQYCVYTNGNTPTCYDSEDPKVKGQYED